MLDDDSRGMHVGVHSRLETTNGIEKCVGYHNEELSDAIGELLIEDQEGNSYSIN